MLSVLYTLVYTLHSTLYTLQTSHDVSGDVERVFGSFHEAHRGGLIHNTYRYSTGVPEYLST